MLLPMLHGLFCVYIFMSLCKLTSNDAVHSYPIFSVAFNKIQPHITVLPVSRQLNAHRQGQLYPRLQDMHL